MLMREDAVPVVLLARRVPVALQEPFRQELERLERGGIIEKVDEPTDWFVPGKELLLADMLSTSPPRNAGDTSGSTEDVDIHAIATVSDMVRFQARDVEPWISAVKRTSGERCRSGKKNIKKRRKPMTTFGLAFLVTVLLRWKIFDHRVNFYKGGGCAPNNQTSDGSPDAGFSSASNVIPVRGT